MEFANYSGKGITSADLDNIKDSVASQVMNIINDETAENDKTYSSKKIENDFVDNNELKEAIDGFADIVYSSEAPQNTKSNSWFKIE